jgi:hypothetical protein
MWGPGYVIDPAVMTEEFILMGIGSARVAPGNPSVAGNGVTLPSTLTPGRSAGKTGVIRVFVFRAMESFFFTGHGRPLVAYLPILTRRGAAGRGLNFSNPRLSTNVILC